MTIEMGARWYCLGEHHDEHDKHEDEEEPLLRKPSFEVVPAARVNAMLAVRFCYGGQ